MKQLGVIFDRFWLPLFLLLSMSWLVAPAIHHVQQYGALAVISHYEAVDQSYAWVFRMCDVAASLVLALGVWRLKIIAKDRPLGIALLLLAGLSAIDGIFPLGCIGTCTEPDRLSGLTHDVESVLSAITLFVTTILAIRRRRQILSVGFLAVQLIFGVIVVSRLPSHALLVVIQFIYEVILLGWIGWLVTQFATPARLSEKTETIIRRTTGIITFLSGVVTILLALPHRPEHGLFFGLFHQVNQPWLVQHGIVVGVLLIYLSRHIAKGQRRAAMLLGILMLSLIIRYALFEPHPFLLLTSLIIGIALWWSRSAYNRNVGPLPIHSRLQDVLRVLAGALVALTAAWTIAITTHHQQQFYDAISHSYRRRPHGHVTQRYRRPLSLALNTLGISLAAILLWSLFRPSGYVAPHNEQVREEAEALLRKHSNSSEDFFKLWPSDGKSYFFNTTRSGFIAYKRSGSVAFALADPIAPDDERRNLVEAFVEYCRGHGWSACFVLISEASRPLYEPKLKTVQIGSSALIDIDTFTQETQREKWWRWQFNRAKKAGFHYQPATPPHNAGLLAELHTVSDTWLTRAGHTEQGFALGYFDNEYLQKCQLHLLRNDQGQLIAFANELPNYGQTATKTVDLIRFLPDVDGAMPVLILHLLNHLHETAAGGTFDLGFVPLAKVDSPISTIARRITQSRFSAAGLEQFKSKFRPDWQANYVAYDGNLVDFAILLANLENTLKVDLPGLPTAQSIASKKPEV